MAACSAVASPAYAEESLQAEPDATADADEVDEDAEGPVSQHGLTHIIVTARRRAEPLQRVPVSAVALSAGDLEARSVTNLRSLQNFVPNLTFAASQNVGEAGANIFIRGIGQEDFAVGTEPGVGVYVDGVYVARTTGILMNLVDVDRIEVLRGPQGTLFGRNAIGGAINVVSVMPQPGSDTRIRVILGNLDRLEFRGVVNEPLSRNLFMRLSLGLVSRDGYLRRLPPPTQLGPLEAAIHARIDSEPEGDDRSQAARLQLRWLIDERLTADLSVDGTRRRNTQGATRVDAIDPRFGMFPQLNRLIREGRLPGPEITADLLPDAFLATYAGGNNLTNQDLWGISAVLTRAIRAGTIRLIGAYRGLRSRVEIDMDGLYFSLLEFSARVTESQYSGELQFSGVTGALTYSAGLFAFGEDAEVFPSSAVMNEVFVTCGCFYTPATFPRFLTAPRRLGGESYAGYAQGTYRIADRLSATLGARYSYERKSIDGEVDLLDANLRPTDIVVATGSNRGHWDAFTYRAGLEYQATADLMGYASIARGYKSGGFNVRASPDLPNLGFAAFAPETALTYEAGLRSEWLNRRLRLNATLFHTDYRNIQLRQQTIVGDTLTTLIENAARARIRGVELELTAVPFDGLTLSAAYGHLAPRFLDVGRVPGITLASRFQRTSSHSFASSINYEAPFLSGTLVVHGDYSYRSREQFQLLPAINDQPGYGLLGARLTFRTRDDRWSFALFGTNLADVRYRTAARGTFLNQVGIAYSSVGLPRQLGVEIATRF